MKLVSSIATASLAIASPALAQANQCYKITDPNAPIWKLAGSFLPDGAQDTVMNLVSSIGSDSIDQCFGSIQASAIGELLPILSSETCTESIEFFTNDNDISTLIAEVQKLTSSSDIMGDLPAFASFLLSVTDSKIGDFCDVGTGKLAPCVVEDLVPIVLRVLEKYTDGCCVDMFSKAEGALGTSDINKFVYEVLQVLMNMVCSVRTPGLTRDTTNHCSYVALQSLVSDNFFELALNILTLVVIPNSASCDAFMGKEFIGSGGDSVILPSEGPAIDSCGESLTDLFGFVGGIPALSSVKLGNSTVGTLFSDDDSCVPAEDIASLLPADSPIGSFLTGCFHVPTAISQPCPFITETADCPFPSEPTDAPEPTTDAPEPTTDAPEPTTDAPEPTTDAPEPTTDAPDTSC